MVIFNADDYGLTPGVCRGINKAHRLGVVRSTSIMANLPHFDESVALLKEVPGLDAGVHINLTFGKPLLDISEVPSLVDDSGRFWRKPSIQLEVAQREDVEKEILAQFMRYKSTGHVLTHLDTHHHLHGTDPRVLEFLMRIAREHKLAIRSLDADMRKRLKEEGIPTPDSFNGDFYGNGNITLENIEKIIETAPAGFSEIMCHPGLIDDELLEISSYKEHREKEVEILTHPKVMQSLQKMGARLVGYQDLLAFSPGFE